MWGSLAINIVAGVLLLWMGYGTKKLVAAWKLRSERRLWHCFSRKDRPLSIALSVREGPFPRSTPRVSLAELRAFTDLIPVLNYLRIEFNFTDHPWQSAAALSDNNFLAFGGPAVNKVTSETLQILQPKLPVRLDVDSLGVVVADRRYKPVYDPTSEKVVTDYAIVIRSHNPFSVAADNFCFLLMGCHGFGTEGAARCLWDSALANQLTKRARRSSFIAILEVKPHLDSYITKILEVYLLPDA